MVPSVESWVVVAGSMLPMITSTGDGWAFFISAISIRAPISIGQFGCLRLSTQLTQSWRWPEWLSPGAFVTAVELARAWDVDRLAGRARVVVDDAAQEREMEDPLVPPELIAGDLAGLVTGATPGRSSAKGVEFFAFRGLAMGDLALATLCAERAEAAGVGTRLPR